MSNAAGFTNGDLDKQGRTTMDYINGQIIEIFLQNVESEIT